MSLMTDIPMMHWLRQADFEHLQGLQNPGDIKVTTPLDFGSNQNAGLISKNDLNQRIGTCLSGVGRLRDDDIDVRYGSLADIDARQSHVGQILDTLKALGVDDNTIVVFASDNGPYGETGREFGNEGTPDMGNSGPFRGELGEATEGSIRTVAIIRWPGQVKPDTTSYAMFSIMDFLPTFSHIVGGKMPTDRPIDGVDQTDVLLGNSMMGHRESLLSFIGADLVAARWKQWRIYFTDVHPTGIGPQREPGIFSASASMAGYPKVYNIEMDPHEDLVIGGLFSWVTGPALKAVDEYLETVKKYPNPPAPNITQFKNGGG